MSLIVIAVVYFKKGVGIESGMRYLKPERKTLGSIYSIGLPAIVMQILTPIIFYALNLILDAISVSAVTAYGVYYKLQNFIFMPGYGLNNASIPIISYNFGAKNKARVPQTIRYGLIYVSVIMLIGIVPLQLFSRQIVGIFSVTEKSHQLCVLALRIITCGFFFAGANIILQGLRQALGKGGYSLVISLLRFVVLALPLAWALSFDREIFNSDRRFYQRLQETDTYLDAVAESEQHIEVKTVDDLLNEIENENLYQALLTADRCTLQIVLLKTEGYSTKEIAPIVGLTMGAVYSRLEYLRKKLKKVL